MAFVPSALAAVLAALMVATVSAQPPTVRLCVPYNKEQAYLDNCTTTLNSFRPAGASFQWQCVNGVDGTDCTAKVNAGTAELTKFGGDDLFLGMKERNLHAYAVEKIDNGDGVTPGVSYYGVAVVNAEFCTDLGTADGFPKLEGKSACMTGYRRGAGWTMPMGHMISSGIIRAVDAEPGVEADAEAAVNFFSRVCAPGAQGNGPLTGTKNKWDPLCTNCAGDCSYTSTGEAYSNYDGALKCLVDPKNAASVAFTKHTTVLQAAAGEIAGLTGISTDTHRLLCKTGGCKSLNDWRTCNIGGSAAHTFVGKPGFKDTPQGAAAISMLVGANATMVAAIKKLGGQPNWILTDAAVGIGAVEDPANAAANFQPETYGYFSTIRNIQVPDVRICTKSPEEQAFCSATAEITNKQLALGVTFSCVDLGSDEECLKGIASGKADMRAFDGPQVFRGFKDHGLKVIAHEDYGDGTAEYYSVAIVNKQLCDDLGSNANLAALQGKAACTTGYRRSAGWQMPTGVFVRSGIMPIVRNDPNIQDDAESFVSFFSKGVCAGRLSGNGPIKTADGKGAKWDKLCSACGGDCSDDKEREPYYDYAGAFRGLMEGKCDVAFTKHTMPQLYSSDGESKQPWSAKSSTDFRLMCRNGGCAPIDQARRCHIAASRAHGVVVRSDYPHTSQLKIALAAAAQAEEFKTKVLNPATNPGNFLFKSTTKNIVSWNDDTRTYLDSNFVAFEGLDRLNAGQDITELPTVRSSSGKKVEVTPGAAAGIAIGCAAAGAIICAVVVLLVKRRNNNKWQGFNNQGHSDAEAYHTAGGAVLKA